MATRCLASAFAPARLVAAPCRRTPVCRAARETWYPGASPPAYLDGSMVGDYGFDPLRIGSRPEALAWYREAELQNGRWSMMACVGVVFTEAFGLPSFWTAGGGTFALDFNTLAIIEIAIMAIFEYKRYENFCKDGKGGFLGSSEFDPMGLKTEEMELREIKNGRLAMVSFIGYCSQAAVTGEGPIACFKAHCADSGHVNIYTSSVGPEVIAAIVALSIAPVVIEAKNELSGGDDEEFNPIPF